MALRSSQSSSPFRSTERQPYQAASVVRTGAAPASRVSVAALPTSPPQESIQDNSGPEVFVVEDEPLPPLRRALYAAACAALVATILFLIAPFGIASFSAAFWCAVLATVLLCGASVTVFMAAARASDTLARSAFITVGVATVLLTVAAAADWFLIEPGVISTFLLSTFLSAPTIETLVRASPAVCAAMCASLLFAAAMRAQLLSPSVLENIRLPTKVQRIERGSAKLVSVRDVSEGNILLFVAGERLSVDGIVSDGNAHLDESAVTGTLTPVPKLLGMHVFAGSTVRSGRLLVVVKAVGQDTMIAQLQSRPVDEFETTLATSARRASRTALICGMGLAALLGALGYMQSGIVAFAQGIAVGFAPAALVVVSISALGVRSVGTKVAQTGARVRTAHALARIVHANTLVLERTGVLTSGAVHVEHVVSFKPYTQQQILNTAAALESHSEHRHAKAIVAFARGMGAVGFQRVDDVAEDTSGISAQLNGKRVVAGNLAYVRRHSVEVPEETLEHAADGKTIILIAADGIPMGYIALREPTRTESRKVVQSLQDHGIDVILLTGEHETVALAHANEVGISTVIADASAADKDQTYAKLRAEGKHVIAVSTVARSEASVSVVLFAQRSTSATVASADIIVRSDDLSALAELVSVVTQERIASQTTARRAWLAGAFAACFVVLPLGGIVFVPVALVGSRLSLRAAR